jgi:50S ribosomal protein L16 3-hydroxylase
MLAFAREGLDRLLRQTDLLPMLLGEALTEPKPNVWFEASELETSEQTAMLGAGVALDRRTRMMYDERHVFINGESFRASGRDARLMRQLADTRRLGAAERQALSAPARELLADWRLAGWLQDL